MSGNPTFLCSTCGEKPRVNKWHCIDCKKAWKLLDSRNQAPRSTNHFDNALYQRKRKRAIQEGRWKSNRSTAKEVAA